MKLIVVIISTFFVEEDKIIYRSFFEEGLMSYILGSRNRLCI